MKSLLKGIIAAGTLGVGVLLGIYLLDGLILWKMLLFFLACWGIGRGVYALLRVVDKRFGAKEK